MNAEIQYKGYSASPSDYQSPDGDLACAMNIIPEKGALAPILPPSKVAHFINHIVDTIHRVPTHENYILRSQLNELCWAPATNLQDITVIRDFAGDNGFSSVTPIGNTLTVLDGKGTIHYFRWKDEKYKYLGIRLPELKAQPYISSHIYDSTEMDREFGIEFYEEKPSILLTGSDGFLNMDETKKLYDASTTSVALYGEVRQNVYNRIFATINQFNRILKQKGYFTAPFFVRFAYRLFDGSHAMHTVPILMVPTTWGCPLTSVRVYGGGRVEFDPLFSASRLTADIDIPANISDWSDVITHIDIYVSQQAISYTDSAEALVSVSQLPFASYDTSLDENGNEVKQWSLHSTKAPKIMSNEREWESVIDVFQKQISSSFLLKYSKTMRSGTSYYIGATGYSSFYFAVDVSGGAVTLYNDSGIPYDKITGDTSFLPLPENGLYDVYLIYGKPIVIADGPSTFSTRIYVSSSPSSTTYLDKVHHYIELRRTDGKDYKEVITDYTSFYKVSELDLKNYLTGFYGEIPLKENVLVNLSTHTVLPDVGQGRTRDIVSGTFSYNSRLNAIVEREELPTCENITSQNPANLARDFDLSYQCAFIKVMENGQTSYYQLSDEYPPNQIPSIFYFAYPRATATELLLYYTDELGQHYEQSITLTRHPFLNLAYTFDMFNELKGELTEVSQTPELKTHSITYGNKIKTSSVNNPFVFSEENTSELPVGKIYALSAAVQALSQGQFGQFPLYAFTDEGVWALEINGVGTYAARQPITRDICLSPESITQLDNSVLFVTQKGIIELAGSQVQCISNTLDGETFDISQLKDAYRYILANGYKPMLPWHQFLINARMLYDYTNQRIIVYNPLQKYAYVLSLESKQWGIMECDISNTINSYPDAMAMTWKGYLVNYSSSDVSNIVGYYVTRPIKLNSPNLYKTITSIIQRGLFKKGHLNTMLYASRDLENWYPVYGSADHYLRGMRGTPYKYFRIASTFNLDKDESIFGCSIQYEDRLNNKLR